MTTERQLEIHKSAELAIHGSFKPYSQFSYVNNAYKNYRKEMAEKRRDLIQELVKLQAGDSENFSIWKETVDL